MMIKNSLLIVFFLGAIVYSHFIQQDNPKPIIQLSEQNRQLNFNNKALSVISLGQKRLLSSLLWVQTLMDGDLEHYKGKDLNSWMFLRFNTITELDPLFYEAYLWGGMYLSIVKDDVLGASKIYKKGLLNYPMDLELNFNSGFNNFFELGNTKEAIQNFETILNSEGGPQKYPRLLSLVERLRQEDGVPYYEILGNLKTRLERTKDPKLKNYLKQTMYAVKATADLECLNKLKKGCETIDFFGNPYLKKGNEFKAKQSFKPFRLYRKN